MIVLNNELNPKIAIKALSLDKRAQNLAEDYFTNVAVDDPKKQTLVVESYREKWQNAAVNYPLELFFRRFWNQKNRQNKRSSELRYKKSWTKCSCGLSYKAPPNPPKAARAGPKASLEGDTKLFKHNVRNLRKGGKFLDVPLSLKDFFPQTTKMIALGFTENTMILDECSTSHQTILLDL